MNTVLKQKKEYSWTTRCILELDFDQVETRNDYELWIVCIQNKEGNQIYRTDITDKGILRKKKNAIEIDLFNIWGENPHEYFIYPKLTDGRFLEQSYLPITKDFLDRYKELWNWVMEHMVPERTVTCMIMGGLANQLFQIMNTVAFGHRHGYTPIFDTRQLESESMVKNKPTYWNSVFANVVKLGKNKRCDTRQQQIYSDPSFTYQEIPAEQDHLVFYGYFSSFRYFDRQRKTILSLLTSNTSIQAKVDQAFHKLLDHLPAQCDSMVSVHVRRGDALLNPTLEKMPVEYYRMAMNRFANSVFVIFSDDISWCKEHFDFPDKLFFVEGEKDYVDLLLMSRCDHHIIGNSTFGWWGTYLNEKKDKRIICPYPWFSPEKQRFRNMRDFYLPGTELISSPSMTQPVQLQVQKVPAYVLSAKKDWDNRKRILTQLRDRKMSYEVLNKQEFVDDEMGQTFDYLKVLKTRISLPVYGNR